MNWLSVDNKASTIYPLAYCIMLRAFSISFGVALTNGLSMIDSFFIRHVQTKSQIEREFVVAYCMVD